MTNKIDFGKMQRTIYTFVIDKLIPKETEMGLRHDAVFTARETDQFWVSEFDELYTDLTRDKSEYEDVMDSLEMAVEAVRDAMANWYGDPWNFGPGEPTAKIKALPDIGNKEYKKLINTFDPGFEKRAKAAEKARKAEWNAKDKAEAVDFKSKIPALLALIKKHEAKGWDKLHKTINLGKGKNWYATDLKDGYKMEMKSVPNRDAKLKKIFAAKDGAELKKLSKKYMPPARYTEFLALGNLFFVKSDLIRTATHNTHICKMIAKDVFAL